MGNRVGIDVGGTFTDVVTVEEGTLSVRKVPSTPSVPDDGVLDGLQAAPVVPESIAFVGHGTTVATNAVLEEEWADTALVTTDGFRDVLEIGRGARRDLYDLREQKPHPIVPRDRRFEVCERVGERGEVEKPVDAASLENVLDAIETTEAESLAVSLLFAFEHDDHERHIVEAVNDRMPELSVSRSSKALPEMREYERTLATALNAALKPTMDRYIGRLDERLSGVGVSPPLRLMQSNGGIISSAGAREQPINTLLSGPAAGVQGAAYLAELAGHAEVITMDMGGTSCDVSLVQRGDPVISTDVSVGAYPVGVPVIDVHTIGAGGGSIAWLDAGDALRVGPRSAGADPGPICYGRGGTEPTVTDAHAVLGRIDPARFLPDSMEPALDRARDVLAETIADSMGTSVEDAASGIIQIANANMERALRVMTVERGHDPRDFAIVAYGGAGPLHASSLANDLDIPRVLVPRTAGVLSALGLVLSDLLHDFSTSLVRPWDDVTAAMLAEQFDEFAMTGRDRLRQSGVDHDRIRTERQVEMQYRGQSYALSVVVPDELNAAAMDTIAERFHREHERRYGHASPDEPIELVTLRLRARGEVDPPDLDTSTTTKHVETSSSHRTVWFEGEPCETAIIDRETLSTDAMIDGPAIVAGGESTVAIYPDQRATVDAYGTLIVEPTEGTE